MATLLFSSRGDKVAQICCSKVRIFDTVDGSLQFEHKFSESEGSERSATPSLVCSFSSDGRLFAVCSENKDVCLWDTEKWEVVSKRTSIKRATATRFTKDDKTLLVADKAGDVYSFSVVDPSVEGKLILGHLSMILDLDISRDGGLIITADRDEKIRVSCLPNAYNIKSFCMGHTNFVSKLAVVPTKPGLLLSGSGDGTLRSWRYSEGKQIHALSLNGEKKESAEEDHDKDIVSCIAASPMHDVICVLREGVQSAVICEVSEEETTRIQEITTSIPWHASFDNAGRLWILHDNPEEPVQVFKPAQENNKTSFTRCEECVELRTALSDWGFLKEGKEKGPKLALLQKKEYDGSSEYFDKKNDRLKRKPQEDATGKQEEQQKRTKTTGS